VHQRLDRVSPLAVPIMLEIGRESVFGGEAQTDILAEAADELIRAAMGEEFAGAEPTSVPHLLAARAARHG
jgi:hypothetical protein